MLGTNIFILFFVVSGRNQMLNTCWSERTVGQRREAKNSIKTAFGAQHFTVGNRSEKYLERSFRCQLRHHRGSLLFVCFSSVFLHSLAVAWMYDINVLEMKRIKSFIHFIDFDFKSQNLNRFRRLKAKLFSSEMFVNESRARFDRNSIQFSPNRTMEILFYDRYIFLPVQCQHKWQRCRQVIKYALK